MRCSWEDCAAFAEHFDQHHPEIQLCYAHAAVFYRAFENWLWNGSRRELNHWLKVFKQAGGIL